MRPVLIALLACAALCGQSPDGSLSALVIADAPSLEQHITLSAWQTTHSTEHLRQPSLTDPEYETQSLWCAASTGTVTLSNGVAVTRQAFFYTPAKPATLPAKVDAALTGQCELLAFWYQIDRAPDLKALVNAATQETGAAWGAAEVLPPHDRLRYGWGSGYWNPYYRWQLPTRTVVIALDPKGPPELPPAAPPRAIVIVRSAALPDAGLAFTDFHYSAPDQPTVANEAVKLSGLAPLPLKTIPALATWLTAAKSLPPARHAAALLAADLAVSGLNLDLRLPDNRRQLEAAGAHFLLQDSGDYVYTHNWRTEAEKLAPASDLLKILRLEDPCSFESTADWRGGLIAYGEKFLHDSPAANPWLPWVHFLLARTTAMRLLLAYPEADGASNPNHGTIDAEALRNAAIAHYRAFLNARPSGAGAQLATREAWRLLAGLPPAPIHFGCTNE